MKLPEDIPGKQSWVFLSSGIVFVIWYSPKKAVPSVSTGAQMA